jgi:hypothetical protein
MVGASQMVKLVKRQNLRFEAPVKEEASAFCARVAKAKKARQEAEAWMR